MKVRWGSTLGAIGVAAGCLVGFAAPASATPVQGPSFNDPTGTPDQVYAIMTGIMDSIDGARPGATIRMGFYSLSIPAFVDKLIAAHDRGVVVRILMDDHAIGPQWDRLVAALGSDLTASSFAGLCHRSCFTDFEPSYLHAKFYMFSSTGGASRVVTVSSGNPSTGQETGFNDAYTMVGDTVQYNSYKKYFEDLTAASVQNVQSTTLRPDYYRTTESGRFKSYFLPVGGKGATPDVAHRILGNISCSGARPGYGTSDGHTIVRVAMYQWTKARVRLAQRLWALDDAGCRVDLVVSEHETDAEVLAALRRSGGRHGGPTLHNASKDLNGNGVVDHFVHDKYLTVEGSYAGDTSAKLVFMGSANWTDAALHYNNEVILRIDEPTTFAAYRANFDRLRSFADSAAPAARLAPATEGPMRQAPGAEPDGVLDTTAE